MRTYTSQLVSICWTPAKRNNNNFKDDNLK